MADVLGVLEGAALGRDRDGIEGGDRARSQRRVLVNFDLDGAVAELETVGQLLDDGRDLSGVVQDEVELFRGDSDLGHRQAPCPSPETGATSLSPRVPAPAMPPASTINASSRRARAAARSASSG